MALYRVYQDLGNGSCVATNNAVDSATGKVVVRSGGSAGRVMPLSQVPNGAKVLPASSGGGSGSNSIDVTEDQIGQMGLARREYQSDAGSMVRTYQISFTNGSGAAVTAYIGDGNTIAYQSNGGTPLPGTVTIGGTWGTNSLAIWQLVTSNTPVRVDKIRLNFDTTSYLTTANLIGYKTRPDAIASTDNFNLSTWVSPDQFQSLIIENPESLRLVWDASYALTTLVPDGRTVTFTFYYVSVADVHNMRIVGRKSGM